MARRVVEQKDFTGGDWGRRQPWNAAPNSFKATNMLLYTTGELGVRPGIQNITPTNVAAGDVAWGMSGDVLSSAYYYGQGTALRRGVAYKNQAQTTMTGSFTGAVTNLYFARMGSASTGNALYIMDPTRGIYSLITTTLTQLNTVGGNGLAFFGDRLCIGYFAGPSSSVRYNGLTAGVSDLTSWPATNIIPVGDRNERPANLWVQRGHLSILKTTNGFFVITGALGVNETLRRAVNTVGPPDGFVGASCVTENDTIWFVADNRHRIPASFDGTRVRYYEDQLLPVQVDGLVNMTPFTVTDPSGVVITTGSASTDPDFADMTKMHIFYRGVWTRHELPDLGQNSQMTSTTNLSVFDPGFDQTNPPETMPYNFHDVPSIVFCDDSAATPVFYSMLLDTDRPGYDWENVAGDFALLNAEMPGDNSTEQVTGQVEFPEVHLKDADEFMVQGVIVDFRSWDTNGTLNNHFDLQVDCLRTYDNSSPITSLTSSWDEAGSLSSTAGTVKRQVFMFGEQGYGNGYQIKMENIRGIAIQRIQVIIDTVKMRGV